ncbi:MAG TPA: hypothetical protein VFO94_02095, partial [Gammaproteobacteria bacterium]|nr:hypothetical protein [Gammaproteobacteria bacterium]
LGKRLWRRLAQAGLSAGAIPGSEDEAFVASGHGITDLVKRPTESAKDLQHEELRAGVQELHEKVRAWQPALILFAFKRVAEIAVDGPVSPGLGPLFEGVPTFLLSGPYASRDEADRVDAELRDVVSRALPGVYQTVVSQRVTDADLEAGIVRLPRAAKELLPVEKSDVSVVLRGTPLVAKYDPKRGGDRERSGVLRIGAPLSRLVKSGDRLRVSRGPNGRVLLD